MPAGKLRLLSEDDQQVRLIRTDIEGWSLRLDKPLTDEIAAALPKTERYGRLIDKVGLVPALGVLAALTISVIAIGYIAPHWIAPHVPMSWERRFGGAMFGDFGKMRCRSPKGQKALEALVERVAPGATKGKNGVKVAALDVPVFNAAALPGGYIVVFEPAIRDSSPDALAGIMAHEIAHVRRRHVTEALIREMGIGALIRMFAGNVGGNAEQILALSYTRDNEAQADSDAIVMCAVVEKVKPEVVSFHFGLPETSLLKRVKACGAIVFGNATTVEEARWLEGRGVDGIIAQGFEAGGHTGRFLGSDPAEAMGLVALLPQVVDSVSVPVIAAGGIADGRGIAAAFMASSLGRLCSQMRSGQPTRASPSHPG